MYKNLAIFLKFWSNLATKNPKGHLFLALLICNLAFWLYVTCGKKVGYYQGDIYYQQIDLDIVT